MRFVQAELDKFDGAPAVLQAFRNTEAVVAGLAANEVEVILNGINYHAGPHEEAKVPLWLDEGIQMTFDHDFMAGTFTYALYGRIPATELGTRNVIHSGPGETMEEYEERDQAFDDWLGDQGGFLKAMVVITPSAPDIFDRIAGSAEFAILEDQAEFDATEHITPREIFERRDREAAGLAANTETS